MNHPDAGSAALKGASLAFHKRKPSAPPSPSRAATATNNGALTAATLSAQSTGGSATGLPDVDAATARGTVAARLQQLGHHQPQQHQQFLHPPPSQASGGRVDPKSPSFIAATLAASRSASPSPKARTPRRKVSVGAMSVGEVVDSDPIATTGSLISMFEGGNGEGSARAVETPSSAHKDEDIRIKNNDEDEERSGSPSARTPRNKPSKPTVQQRSLTPSPSPPPPTKPVGNRSRPVEPPRKPTKAGLPASSPTAVERPRKLTVPQRSLTPPPKPSVDARSRPVELPQKPKEADLPASSPVAGGLPKKPAARPQSFSPPPRPPVETQFRSSGPSQKPTGGDLPSTGPIGVEPGRKPSKPPKPNTLPKTPPAEAPPVRRAQTVSDANSKKDEQPKKPDLEPKKPGKPAKPPLNPLSSPPQPVVSRSQTEVLSPKPTRITKPKLPPPTPPQQERTISRPSPQSPGDPQKKDTPKSQPTPQTGSQKKQQPPTPPKPRGTKKITKTPTASSQKASPRPKPAEATRTKSNETTSTNEDFVSAPTSPEYDSPPLPVRRHSTASPPLSPGRRTHTRNLSHAQSSSNLGFDSLTNAIMAGSLASSRLTPSNTGSSLPPPLPQRQKSPRLRQTMRTPAHASDDEGDRHKKGHHRHKLRSGKHAHHEGSRKKWREEITPRERKRYEAVWASNRGALLPASQATSSASTSSSKHLPPDYGNSVANVVVRDIWRRSRLPEDELVEVWDLVDREKRGMLGRQEFVVGMWLIDQRLKGRKIPTKVSNSVWGSVNGVQVLGPKMK